LGLQERVERHSTALAKKKRPHGHVSYVVQKGVKNSVTRRPKKAPFVPEMSVVVLKVYCR